MITALLTAVIAPACQAAWGNNEGNSQTLLEICTAQGIKMVAIPSNDDAPQDKQSAMPSCDFCFQNTHIHFTDVETLTILQTIPTLQRYKVVAHSAEFSDPLSFPYEAHAPPLKS